MKIARGDAPVSDLPPPPESQPPPHAGARPRLRQVQRAISERLGRSTTAYIFAALVAIVVVFALITPSDTFLSTFNLQTIATDSSVVLIFAVGATLVIISSCLDLSQGSVATFSGVLMVIVMNELMERGSGPWLTIAIGAAVAISSGAAWGAINGWLVAVGRLNSFVVTLGSFGAALGAARLMSGGTAVSGGPDELRNTIGLGLVAGVPVPFLIAAAAALVFGLALAKTRAGERLYLVGSNEEAARRAGINVRRQYFGTFLWSGVLAGLAGFVTVARFSGETVSTGHLTEVITAISGVVIGGASLVGGVGVMIGSVIGIFIPTVLTNGLVILQIQRFWQEVAVGVILVAAVAFDRWRREQDRLRP